MSATRAEITPNGNNVVNGGLVEAYNDNIKKRAEKFGATEEGLKKIFINKTYAIGGPASFSATFEQRNLIEKIYYLGICNLFEEEKREAKGQMPDKLIEKIENHEKTENTEDEGFIKFDSVDLFNKILRLKIDNELHSFNLSSFGNDDVEEQVQKLFSINHQHQYNDRSSVCPSNRSGLYTFGGNLGYLNKFNDLLKKEEKDLTPKDKKYLDSCYRIINKGIDKNETGQVNIFEKKVKRIQANRLAKKSVLEGRRDSFEGLKERLLEFNKKILKSKLDEKDSEENKTEDVEKEKTQIIKYVEGSTELKSESEKITTMLQDCTDIEKHQVYHDLVKKLNELEVSLEKVKNMDIFAVALMDAYADMNKLEMCTYESILKVAENFHGIVKEIMLKRKKSSRSIFLKTFKKNCSLSEEEEAYAKQVAGLIVGNSSNPFINGRDLYNKFMNSLGESVIDKSMELEVLETKPLENESIEKQNVDSCESKKDVAFDDDDDDDDDADSVEMQEIYYPETDLLRNNSATSSDDEL